MTELEKMLSVQDVADTMSVSIETIIRLIKAGTMKATKVGGQWRIKPSDVLEYLGDDAKI